MKIRLSFLVAGLALCFSFSAYAKDFVHCSLEQSGIPTKTKVGSDYTNTYRCTDGFPSGFPAIHLGGSIIGSAKGTSLSGSCVSSKVSSGHSCEFNLGFKPAAAGKYSFHLRVAMGSQYSFNLPTVTTTASTSGGGATITWPSSGVGVATVKTDGTGDGHFTAATDSSGHTIHYSYQLSGDGKVTDITDNGGMVSFNLSDGVKAQETVTFTASADDAKSKARAPITIKPKKVVHEIKWPNSNEGDALVDSNGNGGGSFMPSAYVTDDPSAKVTYTYALTPNTGTVTANNTLGKFDLSGANAASETVTVTANADGLKKSGTPIKIRHKSDIPTKTVTIYNNTTGPIYPVIETLPADLKDGDNWLQGQFGVHDVGTDKCLFSHYYRVYVDPNKGVPAGQSVTVAVPFYAKLTNSALNCSTQDEAVDYWKGARVYIFDDKPSLDVSYNKDKAHPAKLLSTGITCASGSTCEPLTTLVAQSGILPNGGYQLTEYTFANVALNTIPYAVSLGHVDYDLSYVDQTYLPVAMEPHGNPSIGYSGSIETVPTFSKAIANFVAAKGWPTFVNKPAYSHERIPGGYNVFAMTTANAGVSPDNSKAKLAMAALWDSQSGSDLKTGKIGSDCDNSKTDVCQVWNLFKKNYEQDAARCKVPALTDETMLKHIYGWAAFNTCGANRIIDTNIPGGSGAVLNIKTLYQTKIEYGKNPEYNPYVGLVHGSEASGGLGINVTYAFSIDDTFGNMNERGDGIIITVGGSTGLPNTKPFSTVPPVVHISLGAWPANSGKPTFVAYGACTPYVDKANMDNVINLDSSATYPCQITLKDSSGKNYQFTIPKKPPLTTADIVCPAGSKKGSWCKLVQVDTHIQKNVSTPPPDAPTTK